MPKLCWTLVFAGWLLGSLAGTGPARAGTVPRPGEPFIIDVWDTDDGLPQNSVTAILQDTDGYLWFGTLNGLVRFDGLRFEVYDESRTPGLSSSRIVSLFEDRQHNLWIGTGAAGVILVRNGQVSSTLIGQGSSEHRLVTACQDASGAVWLYTADGQLWRHAQDRFTPLLFAQDRPSTCRSLIAEAGGAVWIGADTRLAMLGNTPMPGQMEAPIQQEIPVTRLDYLLASRRGGHWRLADGRVSKYRSNTLERDLGTYPWSRVPVSSACEDSQGNLVVGTLGAGVFWYDQEGKYKRLATGQGLSHNIILSLCLDQEGSLWVGTDGGGLNRVRRQVFEVLDESRGLGSSVVQSVAEDGEGGLWIGSNGGGVSRWQSGSFRHYGSGEGLTNSHVWAVLADREQRIWAGTAGGGLFVRKDGLFAPVPDAERLHRTILALHEDRSGRVWVGTQGGLARWTKPGWEIFTTREGLSGNEIRALADDPGGNLWIGTYGAGLNRYRDGKFTTFRKKDGLPGDDISSLLVDADGVLWVGTAGSGLGRYEGSRWTRYTTKEGLLSNSLGYLVEDGLGNLWIGSNVGVMRVRKQDLNHLANDLARGVAGLVTCRAYGKPDGMPTRECTAGSQPGGMRTRDGRLWFPTVKGLASVHPAQLNPNPHAPPVVIETVWLDGQVQGTRSLRTPPLQRLVVPPGVERLDIEYTALNLGAPDKGRFRYQLADHEKSWVEAGNSRIARYPRLPPGQYTFRVKACNEDGVWNEAGSSLAIVVEPPFWRRGWFLASVTLVLLGAVTGAVHYLSTQRLKRQVQRLQQEEALERERARIARDLHDQLGASLTQVALIGEMVEADKEVPAEVEGHARQICQTARETTRVLDEIVWAVNPSNDTLEGLMTYACKYAQDYLSVAGLRYRLDVPPELPDASMLPDARHHVFLTFKEAITNVVKHSKAASVWIRLKLEPGSFTLEIEDDGRGLAHLDPKAAQTRNGLKNMRKRMESAGGTFELLPGPGRGALVRLTAPLAKR
jgi:ligand-binding sensor domain-containing protein/signal transduction histidine kinase